MECKRPVWRKLSLNTSAPGGWPGVRAHAPSARAPRCARCPAADHAPALGPACSGGHACTRHQGLHHGLVPCALSRKRGCLPVTSHGHEHRDGHGHGHGHGHGYTRPRPRRVPCRAAQDAGGPEAGGDGRAFPYNSGDGRSQKATIEHVFGGVKAAARGGAPMAPWALGWQMNERNVVWNDDLKLRLIKRYVSDELGCSEEEVEGKLAQLLVLLPDFGAQLARAPAKLVARLAGNLDEVAARLLRLRALLPEANVSKLMSARVSLLLDEDLGAVEAAVAHLARLLPGINLSRFVEDFPQVLNSEGKEFENALEDAKRLMPGQDVAVLVRRSPDLVVGCMKGKSLIPYEDVPNPWK